MKKRNFPKVLPLVSGLVAAVSSPAQAADPLSASMVQTSIEVNLIGIRAQGQQGWAKRAPKPAHLHAFGSVLPVTNCEDDGSAGSLRTVVASAQTGDTVDLRDLQCGTIALTQGVIYDNPGVPYFSIVGPKKGALTIDAAGLSSIIFHTGLGTLSITDIAFKNGYAADSWGGCLIAPSGGLALTRVSVSNCAAHQSTMQHGSDAFGGGLMAFAEVTLVDSVVTGNTLSSDLADSGPYSIVLMGGGVFGLEGPVTITRSSITQNSIISSVPIPGQVRGGGVMSYGQGSVTVTDAVIAGNSLKSDFVDNANGFSRSSGAGLEVAGTLSVTNSTFDGNSIVNAQPVGFTYGAGLHFQGYGAVISGSTFSNNDSAGYAAAVHHRGASMSIVDTTISGNHSVGDGAGVWGGVAMQISNSTIAFNVSDTGGGGVALYSETPLRSTIIAGNLGAKGAGDVLLLHPGGSVGSLTGDHNFIGDPGVAAVPADTIKGDPLLLPLSDNGGRTRTHALAAGSPAIDAGSNPLALDFDQRGEGFAREVGSSVDIGAYESGASGDSIFANGFDP